MGEVPKLLIVCAHTYPYFWVDRLYRKLLSLVSRNIYASECAVQGFGRRKTFLEAMNGFDIILFTPSRFGYLSTYVHILRKGKRYRQCGNSNNKFLLRNC